MSDDNIFPFESLYIFPTNSTLIDDNAEINSLYPFDQTYSRIESDNKQGGLTDQDMILYEFNELTDSDQHVLEKKGSHEILDLIDDCECTFKINGPICFSKKFIDKYRKEGDTSRSVVDRLMKDNKVKSQYELLEIPEVINRVGKEQVELEKENFKDFGPWDSDELINDKNITSLMYQCGQKWKDFYPMPFEMIDFEEQKNNPSIPTFLAKTDFIGLVKKGYKTFGCVINTDLWANLGKHWFAMFIDLRSFLDSLEKLRKGEINKDQVIPIQIEYFNSSGMDPKLQIHRKMIQILHEFSDYFRSVDSLFANLIKIAEVKKITELEIQKSHTECGVFSLIYIFSRLKNKPQSWFEDVGIKDSHMLKFRKRLFLNL